MTLGLMGWTGTPPSMLWGLSVPPRHLLPGSPRRAGIARKTECGATLPVFLVHALLHHLPSRCLGFLPYKIGLIIPISKHCWETYMRQCL